MAHHIATADGNFTAAATWGVVDSGSLLDAQNFTVVAATAASWTQGATITPTAIVDGIAVKVGSINATPSGTFSVRIYDVTAGAAVAGTTVTINVSDIPSEAGITPGNTYDRCSIGWVFLKFGAPVDLSTAGPNYRVEAQTSAASQVTLFRNSTANNFSRMLRTTTTGAPGAGDSMFVLGEWTAAATKTDRAVTMDSTAATDYGGTSQILASLGIGKGGTLTWGTTAATNYILRLSGLLQVWAGGTMTMGTTGTPVPDTGSALLEFDCATTGNFGLVCWGNLTIQGSPRTAGKPVVYTRLASDASSAATSLTVDDDTGWLNGDTIGIAGTNRTANSGEANALTAGAGASTLTVTAIGNDKGGTDPIKCEIVLTTFNVVVQTVTSTAGAYCEIHGASVLDIDWCQFKYMFSASTTKQGLRICDDLAGTANVDYFNLFGSANSARHISVECTSVALTWSNITAFHSGNVSTHSWLAFDVSYTGDFSLTDWCSILNSNSSGTAQIYSDIDAGSFSFTRVHIANGRNAGVYLNGEWTGGFAWTDGAIHSINAPLITFVGATGHLEWNGVDLYRSAGAATGDGAFAVKDMVANCTFVDCNIFGNIRSAIDISNPGHIVHWRFVGGNIGGDTGFAQPRGLNVQLSAAYIDMRFENVNIGVTSGIYVAHTSADFGSAASLNACFLELTFVNSTLGSTTEFETSLTDTVLGYSFAARQRKDGTTNTHEKLYWNVGTIAYETTTFRNASPSEKLTPSGATSTRKLNSSVKRIAVPSGQATTVGAYVQKDGSYTGSQPRLILKANPALGIDADTVLDTMTGSSGSWEQLTGTSSPVAEEDGVLEVYVDCDGSAGNVFVDDWSASVA